MEESGGILSLSVTVGGQEACEGGAVEERAWHSGMDEGDGAKKGVIAVVDAFYGCSVARAERKTGRGSGVQRHVEGKMGKREGPQAWRGTARVPSIIPRLAGTGGAVAARQGRAAGRERLRGGTERHWGPVGSDWVWEGVRGSKAVKVSRH
jgi:hypothetical protein